MAKLTLDLHDIFNRGEQIESALHNILREACTGCSSCIEKCPTEALTMKPVPVTLQHWVWPKPLAA